MCWLWLFLAIVLEVAATVCMKWSDGFSKLLPALIMTLLYGVSFVLFALALRQMEVGTAYAVWSALGTALVTTAGIVLFKEAVSPMKVAAIGLIVVGVIFLNMSDTQRRSSREAESASSALPNTDSATDTR